jgi:hypothetical protein
VTAAGAGEVVQTADDRQACPQGWTGRRLRCVGPDDTHGAGDPQITVSLTDNPAVTARGASARSRPRSDTHPTRVGLTDPPRRCCLGDDRPYEVEAARSSRSQHGIDQVQRSPPCGSTIRQSYSHVRVGSAAL